MYENTINIQYFSNSGQTCVPTNGPGSFSLVRSDRKRRDQGPYYHRPFTHRSDLVVVQGDQTDFTVQLPDHVHYNPILCLQSGSRRTWWLQLGCRWWVSCRICTRRAREGSVSVSCSSPLNTGSIWCFMRTASHCALRLFFFAVETILLTREKNVLCQNHKTNLWN